MQCKYTIKIYVSILTIGLFTWSDGKLISSLLKGKQMNTFDHITEKCLSEAAVSGDQIMFLINLEIHLNTYFPLSPAFLWNAFILWHSVTSWWERQ